MEELKFRECDLLSSYLWKADTEAQWVELLDPFTALKNLYLTSNLARHVCDALVGLSGVRATEMLPALRNLFVQEFQLWKGFEDVTMPFVAARQLSVTLWLPAVGPAESG